MISAASAFGGAAGGHDHFRPRLAAELGDETLDMDAVLGNAELAAGRLDVLAHPCGAADEDVIDTRGRNQRAQQHPHLLAVEPAVQDRDVLLFARDDMEKREPLQEAVFQLFQRFEEQHA